MWSSPYKVATKAAILCILQLLAVTQQVYGVETRLTDDVEGLFNDKPVTGQAWVGNKYFTFVEIGSYYDSLVKRNDKLVHKVRIGTTGGGNPIWAIHFTTGSPDPKTFFSTPDDRKMKIWVQCLIHPREWVSGSACLYFSEALVQTYNEKGRQAFRDLFNTWDFIIIPVVNPDGYEFTFTSATNRFWRMNREPIAWNKQAEKAIKGYYRKGDRKVRAPKLLPDRLTGKWPTSGVRDPSTLYPKLFQALMLIRYNQEFCTGVDLNRNFPYKWASEKRASKYPCVDENYVGPSEGSERETQIIIKHFKEHHPIMAAVDFHSYFQVIIRPWGCIREVECREDLKMLMEGAKALQQGLGEHKHQYDITDAYHLGGTAPVSGSFIDWAFSEGVATDNKLRSGQAYRTLPYAVELRPKMGSQEVFKNGFVFPEKDLEDLAWEASLGVWKLFLHVRQNYRAQAYPRI